MTEPTAGQIRCLEAFVACGGTRPAAARLGLSYNTVRVQLAAVRETFGAHNSAQAFAIAVQRGLIDPHVLLIENDAA